MREFGREERVGSQIQRELANLLRHQVRDPRLQNVTIQEVRVVRDFSHARIFFTLLDTHQSTAVELALNKAANFLRRRLADLLALRTIPKLHFEYDHSFETGMHLSSLIDHAIGQETASEIDKEKDALA